MKPTVAHAIIAHQAYAYQQTAPTSKDQENGAIKKHLIFHAIQAKLREANRQRQKRSRACPIICPGFPPSLGIVQSHIYTFGKGKN
jgi:hypothetical protein